MKRPHISPDLLAKLTDGAPARLVRKLDKKPEVAEAWDWKLEDTTLRVTTESGETVSLAEGPLSEDDDVSCSCLLAPRCLHVLAVVSRLALVEPTEQTTASIADSPPEPLDEEAELKPGQQQATENLWLAVAGLLDVGALASGAMAQANLARAIHSARAVGLHRLASAGARLIAGVRSLRERGSEFSLSSYTNDLLEALSVSWAIDEAANERGKLTPALLGTARRTYRPVGNLRLHGLCCEPIIAGTGYAGVNTYLTDGDKGLYSVVDVVPAELQSAQGSYDKAVRFAEASLSHRELCREGLFMQGATASPDGRLGAGKDVRAVRAKRGSWQKELADLWQTPLDQQLERAYRNLALPAAHRPAGADMLFVRALVVGVCEGALVLRANDGTLLRGIAPGGHERLHHAHNLQLLGRAAGFEAIFLGRLRPEPCTFALLAFSGLKGEEATVMVTLPESWQELCNLGFDQLQPSYFTGLSERTAIVSLPELRMDVDPLAALRRRIERLALGGRATLPPEATNVIETEARLLEERMLKNGAHHLRALHQASLRQRRTRDGTRGSADDGLLARCFVATATYHRAAATELQRLTWR